MIEKMKFVSISGPKNDLDRMVNQYLSHYEIQLENALTELRSASKLEPYPGTNPYREPLQKAQKLLASCPGAKQQEISTGTMPVENAITLVNDMDTELAASDAERDSLKAKEKRRLCGQTNFVLLNPLCCYLPIVRLFHVRHADSGWCFQSAAWKAQAAFPSHIY